ncbi:MAG: hypothetical protein A2029_09055 [Chloroflexi bacterium RBG_19FT_COMBO_47_9]|nr:MAG: hypothetical protein A2029_09055 [Chloroflexi bacterium RBG_19FT_COMBO_47_9]
MENEITAKRGLILLLVIASVAIFIGLVWLIATYLPRNLLGFSSLSIIPSAPRVEKDCTYPVAYWVEHPEQYPPRMVLGSKVYQANDIREALNNSNQDPRILLQAQLVGAFLNISAGADQSLLETTIFQAYNWLMMHPDGSQVSESDLETGSRYYSVLEAYNLGLAGVPPCEDGYSLTLTQIPIPSTTPTLLLTSTSSQTFTSTPSETASPTFSLVTPIYTSVYRSQTPIPTTQPPGGPAPTRTSPPPAATPTFTQPPPPTATYTLPPLPTATYTLPPPP